MNSRPLIFSTCLLTLFLSPVTVKASSNDHSSNSLEEQQNLTIAVARQISKHKSGKIEKSPKKIQYIKLIEKASPGSRAKLILFGKENVDIIQSQLKVNNSGLWRLSNRRLFAHKSPILRGSITDKEGVRRSLRFNEAPFKELTNIDCENEFKKNEEKENLKRNLDNKRKAECLQLEERIEKTKKLSPYGTRKALDTFAPLVSGFQKVCEKIIFYRTSNDFKKLKGLLTKRDAIVQKFYECMPHETHYDLIYNVVKSNHYNKYRERHFYVFKSDVQHLLDLKDDKCRTNRKRLELGMNFFDMVWHHIGQGVTSTEVILLISKTMHQDQYTGLHFNKKDSFVPRDGFNIDKKEMNQYLLEMLE